MGSAESTSKGDSLKLCIFRYVSAEGMIRLENAMQFMAFVWKSV